MNGDDNRNDFVIFFSCLARLNLIHFDETIFSFAHTLHSTVEKLLTLIMKFQRLLMDRDEFKMFARVCVGLCNVIDRDRLR